MLNVLQDIGEAQTLLSSAASKKNGKGKGAAAAKVPAVPHPTDVNYGALNADLKLVSPKSHEYKTIKWVGGPVKSHVKRRCTWRRDLSLVRSRKTSPSLSVTSLDDASARPTWCRMSLPSARIILSF